MTSGDAEFRQEVIERLVRLETLFTGHIDEERRSERKWTWISGVLVTITLGVLSIYFQK